MERRRLQPSGLPSGVGATPGTPRAQVRRASGLDRTLSRRLIAAVDPLPVRIVLWDGETLDGGRPPVATLHFSDRGALFRMMLQPEVGFGDMYAAGRLTLDGDLVRTLEAAYRAVGSQASPRLSSRLRRMLIDNPSPSRARARANIHHHYDLGNEFYRLWLDRDAMQYTCAYYPEAALDLEAAQRAKMDHVCRKLWLRPGERVVEAGCGWGGFALHMARMYGVRVRAFNISSEQIAWAREWARREGLAGQVEFVEADFREIDGHYDAFVSIGMLEHVGPGNYGELGRVIDRCLVDGGRGLLHTIGRDRPAPLSAWIRKRIFPGAYPPTLREIADVLEPNELSVLDIENLRLHYARTLRDWLSRYETHHDRVVEMFDQHFARAWRLYLAGSIAGFTTGSLQLFQVLFARSGRNRIPVSRAHLYVAGAPVVGELA